VINVTLDNGMVHTFRRVLAGAYTDVSELWESQIELVQGYVHNGEAIYNLPDWKKAVIEQYPEDVKEAAEKFAAEMGIKL